MATKAKPTYSSSVHIETEFHIYDNGIGGALGSRREQPAGGPMNTKCHKWAPEQTTNSDSLSSSIALRASSAFQR